MQKIEIFWGSAPDPTVELTALLPSWWDGADCPPPPKLHSLLSAIRVSSFGHFGPRPCETPEWGSKFKPHGKIPG